MNTKARPTLHRMIRHTILWALESLLPPLITFVLVLTAWHLITVLFKVPRYLVPGPGVVWQAAYENHANLWRATLTTAKAATAGFLLSLGLGTLAALVFSQSVLIRRSIYPYAIFLQTVPSVAIAPLVITWFGPGFASVVFVALVIGLFPIITNATAGLMAVDPNLLELFQLHNASRWQILFKLRLPHAIPYLVTGARISCGLSLIGAIVGEFSAGFGGNAFGLGYLILQTSGQLKTDYLFAATLTSTLLGLAMFCIVSLLGSLVLYRWQALPPGGTTT